MNEQVKKYLDQKFVFKYLVNMNYLDKKILDKRAPISGIFFTTFILFFFYYFFINSTFSYKGHL